jgi:polyhydroxybutyrate depolymerase
LAWKVGDDAINTLRSPFKALLYNFFLLLVGFQLIQTWTQNTLPVNQQPSDRKGSISIDGRDRSYVVHIPPAYNGQDPVPLIIALHGGGGNATNAMKMTGMSDKADKAGFVVAYPNGTGRLKNHLLTWNAGNCCGYALAHHIDDVAFIRAMIEHLQKELTIDARKIYVTGMSNGAKMTYKLACELSDKIAAIAPVAGSLDVTNCQPNDPVSVMIFHGTADKHVLYQGGKPEKSLDKHERVDNPVSYAVSFWVKFNHCSVTPQKEEKGNIIREVYTGGKDGTEVVLYTITAGEHAWPGGRRGSRWGDTPTQEISATELMLEFFLRHPKK